MKTTNNSVAVVKTVAPATTENKKKVLISEDEYKELINGRSFPELLKAIAEREWDGKALSEDQVYHLCFLASLRIYIIKANRRTHRRALKMMEACTKNGMTTPAILVDAKVVHDWNLEMADPATMETITEDQLDGAYCIMEGHGRLHGWLVDYVVGEKDGRKPFDFHFIYKHYDSAEEFGKAYVSTNSDMTRSTNKDKLGVAAARCKHPLVQENLRKMREDYVIAKASYFWTFGRELNKDEVTALIYGTDKAPQFNQDLTDTLKVVYEAFKVKFGLEGAEKIYRGVSAAQWSADRLKTADDKQGTANVICEKLKAMDTSIYTAILTASSNSKKNITRDQVIKYNLSKMMK